MKRARIQVVAIGSEEYLVTVDAGCSTSHRVHVSEGDLLRFGLPGERAESLLERAFRFLLEREPNTSILGAFPVSLIGHYFPEFESEIRNPVA